MRSGCHRFGCSSTNNSAIAALVMVYDAKLQCILTIGVSLGKVRRIHISGIFVVSTSVDKYSIDPRLQGYRIFGHELIAFDTLDQTKLFVLLAIEVPCTKLNNGRYLQVFVFA